jgi:tetratricopeptide (TPR) repeat protein
MLKKLYLFISIFLILASSSSMVAQTTRQIEREKSMTSTVERRIALVIGNGAYKNTAALSNPVNDAVDMTAALKDLGFEVISGTNQNKAQMQNLFRQFGTRLADTKGIGLFFYAGHGISQGGTNYLIPVDADIQAEDEIEEASVSINFLLNKMAAANNGFNMVILDACRNNPFARKWRNYRDIGDKGGLARIDAPTGTLIAYATKPGDVASDGTGRNGLYTGALLRQMRVKNVDVTKMLQLVRADVIKLSGGKQVPFDESSLVGDFYFAGQDKSTVTTSRLTNVLQPEKNSSLEDEYWNNIKGSDEIKDYEAYLREYPSGRYAALARQRMSKYEARDEEGMTAKQRVNRSLSFFEKGNHEEAIAETTRAIKLAPDFAGAYFNRGSIYLFGLKDYPKAVADFDRALEIDPQYVPAYNGRGVAYFNLKQYDRAVADHSKAIELNPKMYTSYSFRANAYEKLGNKMQAKADRAKYDELKRELKR